MGLERHPRLPTGAGVNAMLGLLETTADLPDISVGKVCGGRVAAVVLSTTLELHSLILEAWELDDAGVAQQKTVGFIEALRQIGQNATAVLEVD